MTKAILSVNLCSNVNLYYVPLNHSKHEFVVRIPWLVFNFIFNFILVSHTIGFWNSLYDIRSFIVGNDDNILTPLESSKHSRTNPIFIFPFALPLQTFRGFQDICQTKWIAD